MFNVTQVLHVRTLLSDLKTKVTVACELRDLIDTVKDPDASRVIPHMIPVLVDCLRSGEASYQKDTLEYAFRKALLEVLQRIPSNDAIRPQANALFSGMLHVIRTDNEENAIICCKILSDLTRAYRPLGEDLGKEVFAMFQERCRGLHPLVQAALSEDSPQLDGVAIVPSGQSLKVFYEMSVVLYTLLQLQRPAVASCLQEPFQIYLDLRRE